MPTAGERLGLLYEVSRGLAAFTDLEALVGFATRRIREVFAAEGCAVLLLDRARRELTFPVASQAEGVRASAARLAEIRFPADRGVAGWVLAHGEAALVEDAARDERFYPGIDQLTGMTTRALLCAPLRAGGETRGVVAVVNPTAGPLARDDLLLLEALASDIAVAYERAALYAHLRREVVGLRQVCRMAGAGLVVVGMLIAMVGVAGHLAWALPASELPTRPVMVTATLLVLAGGGLAAVPAVLATAGRRRQPGLAPDRA
jgi:GAF domain-containing protein